MRGSKEIQRCVEKRGEGEETGRAERGLDEVEQKTEGDPISAGWKFLVLPT